MPTPNIPNTITAGQPITAEELQENFDYLEDLLDNGLDGDNFDPTPAVPLPSEGVSLGTNQVTATNIDAPTVTGDTLSGALVGAGVEAGVGSVSVPTTGFYLIRACVVFARSSPAIGAHQYSTRLLDNLSQLGDAMTTGWSIASASHTLYDSHTHFEFQQLTSGHVIQTLAASAQSGDIASGNSSMSIVRIANT